MAFYQPVCTPVCVLPALLCLGPWATPPSRSQRSSTASYSDPLRSCVQGTGQYHPHSPDGLLLPRALPAAPDLHGSRLHHGSTGPMRGQCIHSIPPLTGVWLPPPLSLVPPLMAAQSLTELVVSIRRIDEFLSTPEPPDRKVGPSLY